MRIATYGSIFLLGCALANVACAISLEYCREQDKKQISIEEKYNCWKRLADPETSAQPDEAQSQASQTVAAQTQETAKETVAKDKSKAPADIISTATRTVLLEAHEPNRVGYTKDNDDVGFMDFTLSMQYPLFLQQLQEKSPPEFSVGEFNSDYPIDNLCNRLKTDKLVSECGTVADLNNILGQDELYKKVMKVNMGKQPSERLNNLDKACNCDKNKTKCNLRKLHRIALEEFYPQETPKSQKGSSWLPYMAFTGRFGQYIGTRSSSPVIAKRFNPKLFVRWFLNGKTVEDRDEDINYIDFEYAHESNGQSVDSLASFNNHANDLGSAAFAKDYISRGWDYIGVTGQWHPQKTDKWTDNWTLGGSVKKYIGGFLQGNIEEYFAWEAPRTITKRNQVNGLQMSAKYKLKEVSSSWFGDASFKWDTGSNHPFRYNTYTLELEITPFSNFLGAPMAITYRNGYNSDIAQYFVKGSSIGFGLKFETFGLGKK